MKRLIPIIAIIIILFIIFKAIDFGKLTINIIERSARIKIEYNEIKGSIIKGFELKSYKIKLTPDDSIYGISAQINYRFNPFSFRLPALFEIILIEPNIILKKKEGGGVSVSPNINLSLRINLKNGRLIYEDKRKYTIDGISGLIFLDFLGNKFLLSTMNLSFTLTDYPVVVTAANLSLSFSPTDIKVSSFKIKGRGFFFEGRGHYVTTENYLSINFVNGTLNLKEIGVYDGLVIFGGEIELLKRKIRPRLRGSVRDAWYISEFNFETNFLMDTVIISIFDGKLLNGLFSAQIKGTDLRDLNLQANFKNIDLKEITKWKKPLLLSGYLGYQNGKFVGLINSPADSGLKFDSLIFRGEYSNRKVIFDSLFINDPNRSLFVKGPLYPECSLLVLFNKFDLTRFNQHLPLEGSISGDALLLGKGFNFKQFKISTDITGNNIKLFDFNAQQFSLNTRNFVFRNELVGLELNMRLFSYKRFVIDTFFLNIDKEIFKAGAKRKRENLILKGRIIPSGQGIIDSLIFDHEGLSMRNNMPINFDILKKEISDFSFLLAGGILYGSFRPFYLELKNMNLEEIARGLNLAGDYKGEISFKIAEDRISLNGQKVTFMGLRNGTITLDGEYKDTTLLLKYLLLTDEIGQKLDIDGILSLRKSNLNFKFENFRPWVFPFLNSFMEDPHCLLSGDVEFVGNLNQFKLTGMARIEQGSFGIPVIPAKFDSVFSDVQFTDDRIIFNSAKGRIYAEGTKGSGEQNITGGGVIRLEPGFKVKNFYFDFSFKDASLRYQNFAYGVGTGNFSISKKDSIMSYNGNINIKEGIVPLEFGTKFENPSQIKQNENWRLNLKLSGDRNIWLRNRDTDIEFWGEVYLIKEPLQPLYFSGNLMTRRGNFYWLNHILKITSGEVNFIPEEKINPEINFWAELNTKEREPKTNQEIKIILHCFGTITEPIFEFFSEPPLYSEQDILTYLNLNITWREIESMKEGDYVGRVLPQSILAWLESDVSRKLRTYTGLDYFHLEAPLLEPDKKTKLTVGKYVSRNLFITYTYDITSYSNEFNVEYFIDDRNEILIKRDETGEYSLQYQYRIRF